MVLKFYPLKISDIRRETADCLSLAFAIPEELKQQFLFQPGQNLTLRKTFGDQELRRSYSICSAPFENEVRIAVKRASQGKFSAFIHQDLKPGDTIDVLPPAGRFFTPLIAGQKKQYLAFAVGSGITPIISIIKSALNIEKESRFTLVYGNQTVQSIIFRDQLAALKNLYPDRLAIHYILSRETVDSPINNGRIDVQKCREMKGKLFQPDQTDEVFICGPETMIFPIADWLNAEGIDQKNIHFELFSSPGAPSVAAFHSAENRLNDKGSVLVKVKAGGIQYQFYTEFEDLPLLDAGIRAGLDLPYSCRGGVCATCKARLVAGEVKMDINYALEEDEIARGYILSCQAYPLTGEISIDFDQ